MAFRSLYGDEICLIKIIMSSYCQQAVMPVTMPAYWAINEPME